MLLFKDKGVKSYDEDYEYHYHFSHDIDCYEEFYHKVETMMTLGMIKMENVKIECEVVTVTFKKEKIEIFRHILTSISPPKMIMSKPIYSKSKDYNALPDHYENTLHIKSPSPILQTKLEGLKRSESCFTPKELEKKRKAEKSH